MSRYFSSSTRTGQARRFGLLTIALIILVFGLARWEVSLMLISLIVAIALVVLVIYYQTANRRDL